MKKWVLWGGVIFALAILSSAGYLYQFVGGKEYWKAWKYVGAHPLAEQNLYGTEGRGVYGGILAGVWRGRIGVWGQGGLKVFRVKNDTRYARIVGCATQREEDLRTQDFVTLGEWGDHVDRGDLVIITYDAQNNELIESLWGADFWMFVEADLTTQCKKAEGV